MTDFSNLSDGEINMAVAKLMGTYRYVPEKLPCDRHLGRNYCNSWADAGPIAEKSQISLNFMAVERCWEAYDSEGESKVSTTDIKPCRAICIVFLMMNEGE
ncbi:protein of unknown function DUF2591 [Erwinia phage Gungnir39]|nr:protein of unknown function DUF2591 [Erwinia phage Gungnir39]